MVLGEGHKPREDDIYIKYSSVGLLKDKKGARVRFNVIPLRYNGRTEVTDSKGGKNIILCLIMYDHVYCPMLIPTSNVKMIMKQ